MMPNPVEEQESIVMQIKWMFGIAILFIFLPLLAVFIPAIPISIWDYSPYSKDGHLLQLSPIISIIACIMAIIANIFTRDEPQMLRFISAIGLIAVAMLAIKLPFLLYNNHIYDIGF